MLMANLGACSSPFPPFASPPSSFSSPAPSSFAAPVPSSQPSFSGRSKATAKTKARSLISRPSQHPAAMTARRKRGKKKYQRFFLIFLPPRGYPEAPSSHRLNPATNSRKRGMTTPTITASAERYESHRFQAKQSVRNG